MNFRNFSVEIVIPVFNGSNYLREALHSALSQSYTNVAVTVVDDGSDDSGATLKIVSDFGPRVKLIKKNNGGVGSALNEAIWRSEADYISWLSHDDLYGPKKIENQVREIQKLRKPLDTILFTSYFIIDDKSKVIQSVNLEKLASKDRIELGTYPLIRSFISGCTLLFPNQVVKNNGGFDENLKYTQDYDLWFRLSSKVNFVFCPSQDTYVRVHPQQDSQRTFDTTLTKENDALWTMFMDNTEPAEFHYHFDRIEIKSIFYNHLKNSTYFGAKKYSESCLEKYIQEKMRSKKFFKFYLFEIDNLKILSFGQLNFEQIKSYISLYYEHRQTGKAYLMNLRERYFIWNKNLKEQKN
jgi:glycosyltransferase involved in cell wall biosynthesis